MLALSAARLNEIHERLSGETNTIISPVRSMLDDEHHELRQLDGEDHGSADRKEDHVEVYEAFQRVLRFVFQKREPTTG